GALCELLGAPLTQLGREEGVRRTGNVLVQMSDSAEITLRTWSQAKSDLATAVCNSENARRLLAIPELRDDVAFCLQRDVYPIIAELEADGAIRHQPGIS
ncbi:MAG TPA: 2-phosphosulfolactate phosphatase, partial [Verrucomicrobiae bacterium]|nr:2-phosphosulfolactate phosphatase [Verrucomicrobiae bacterium]